MVSTNNLLPSFNYKSDFPLRVPSYDINSIKYEEKNDTYYNSNRKAKSSDSTKYKLKNSINHGTIFRLNLQAGALVTKTKLNYRGNSLVYPLLHRSIEYGT